jgi:osmotically-inducible protein OsmY
VRSRSDRRIRRKVLDQLRKDDRVDASRLKVNVENGAVTLSGDVPAYRDGTAARAAARRVAGVTEVVDTLTAGS